MRYLVPILLFIGACLVACNDDENPFEFTGSATALKNGEHWKSGLRVAKNLPYDIGIDLIFTVLDRSGIEREHLSIVRVNNIHEAQKIYLTTIDDTYLMSDSISILYTTLIDDGDVLGDIYGIDTTYNDNYVRLTKIDPSKCEITGVFNLKLVLIRDDNDGPTPPNILEFTNGQFKSRVKKEWIE